MPIYRVIAMKTDVSGRWYAYSSSWHRTPEEALRVMAERQAEGFECVMTPSVIPPPWQSRLDQDVLMAQRLGGNWRLLNRFRVQTRAQGLVYGGVYWMSPRRGWVYSDKEIRRDAF